MPLLPGKSRSVVSQNVADMMNAGHPQKQAVAASLSNARKFRKGKKKVKKVIKTMADVDADGM